VPEIEAGESVEIEFIIRESDWIESETYDYFCVDVNALYDDDFTYNFDNTLDSNDRLSGPEEYPSLVVQELDTANTRRTLTTSRFESVWNDTSNSQFVELANDGSTYTRINNSSSGSVNFNADNRGVDVRLGLSRFSDGTDRTPTEGNVGQSISFWELFANPDSVVEDGIGTTVARAIVPPDTSGIVGNTVRECGLKNGSTLLTRHELADFVLESGQRLASSESTTFKGTE